MNHHRDFEDLLSVFASERVEFLIVAGARGDGGDGGDRAEDEGADLSTYPATDESVLSALRSRYYFFFC